MMTSVEEFLVKKSGEARWPAVAGSRDYERQVKDAVLNRACLVSMTDLKGIIIYINNKFCEVSQYSAPELLGANHNLVRHPDMPEEVFKKMWSVIGSGRVFHGVLKNRKKSGAPYWVDAYILPVIGARGEPEAYIGIRYDITELVETRESLMRSEAQLRNFAQHINTMMERDRAFVARELHDEVGQYLTSIKMHLSRLNNNPAGGNLDECIAETEQAMSAVRRISRRLRPGLLSTIGLVGSIRMLVEEFVRNTGTECKLELNAPEIMYDDDLSLCFYRVCQESLTNVERHANASFVIVKLEKKENRMILMVSDNGQGISTADLEDPLSIGLTGMRERTNLLGGNLNIISKKNAGTTILLESGLVPEDKNQRKS